VVPIESETTGGSTRTSAQLCSVCFVIEQDPLESILYAGLACALDPDEVWQDEYNQGYGL